MDLYYTVIKKIYTEHTLCTQYVYDIRGRKSGMAKIITYINEKGGVGKTSACFNTAWVLASQGKKILMIDMDGQKSNLTFFAGIEKEDSLLTIMDVLKNGRNILEIATEITSNLWIVPADSTASNMGMDIKVTGFRKELERVRQHFDYIFIDVNPTPGWGHYLALSVCDYAVVVMLPDIASLEGNSGILESIEEIQGTTNNKLKIAGFLFNRNNATKLSRRVNDIANGMAEIYNTTVFQTKIPQGVSLGECVASHMGVTEYDPSSKPAEAIKEFAAELELKVK